MVNSLGPVRGRGPDRGPAPTRAPAPPRDGPRADTNKVHARIVDEAGGAPISGARYEVVSPEGRVVAQGTTDWQGIVQHDVPQAGRYTVRVVEMPPPAPPAAPAAAPAPTPAPSPAPGADGSK